MGAHLKEMHRVSASAAVTCLQATVMVHERNKRVLWLLNHTTLREFEVPLLEQLGYEVFCPKRFPRNADNRSASVSFAHDCNLTIPSSELELLNSFDFYGERFPPEIRRILNHRFGTLFVAYMFPMLDQALRWYQGKILLRVFGATHPTYTYYSFAKEVAAPGFERRLAKVSQRFWFAQAYPNLKLIEPEMIQSRSVHLPLGLPDRVTSRRGTWTGGAAKILFVCPEIERYTECKKIYREFKRHFGKFPHAICGAQSKPVKDPAVLGKVDSETYDMLFRTCNVMFYHSRLPRHIHYHPLEAACYGMPLVYMQEGMLGKLTDSKLPGACSTFREARCKVATLIREPNSSFAQTVRTSQRAIADLFTNEYTLEKWNSEFVLGVQKSHEQPQRDSLRIAVLPIQSSEEIAQSVKGIIRRLSKCSNNRELYIREGLVSLSSGLPTAERSREWDSLEKDVSNQSPNLKVVRSPFFWRKITSQELRYSQRLSGCGAVSNSEFTIAPDDGQSMFQDCDLWVVVGNHCEFPIADAHPYIFCYTRPKEVPGANLSGIIPDFQFKRRKLGSLDSAEVQANTAVALQNAAAIFVSSLEDLQFLVREYGVNDSWIEVLQEEIAWEIAGPDGESEKEGERLWDLLIGSI